MSAGLFLSAGDRHHPGATGAEWEGSEARDPGAAAGRAANGNVDEVGAAAAALNGTPDRAGAVAAAAKGQAGGAAAPNRRAAMVAASTGHGSMTWRGNRAQG
jgi:hypothetical protein